MYNVPHTISVPLRISFNENSIKDRAQGKLELRANISSSYKRPNAFTNATELSFLNYSENNVKRTGPKFLIQQSVMSCAKHTSPIPVIQIHAKNVVWITVREKTEKTKNM